ncbi:MAG: hypothetical protein LBC97_14010 [Bifidobacteriaceae bacterium]|nr:hypothetical protein [Bifidobacteriaceae bacterium]
MTFSAPWRTARDSIPESAVLESLEDAGPTSSATLRRYRSRAATVASRIVRPPTPGVTWFSTTSGQHCLVECARLELSTSVRSQ